MLILIFGVGIIYHFRIRNRCIYPVELTKQRGIILIIISLVFLSIAYYIGKGLWYNYLLAIFASMFITSAVIGQGISEKGIYYRPLGAASKIIRLAKWEDIKNIKFNDEKNKLEEFKYKPVSKTSTIFPDQYYDLEDIDKINKYIKTKIKEGL